MMAMTLVNCKMLMRKAINWLIKVLRREAEPDTVFFFFNNLFVQIIKIISACSLSQSV